MRVTGVRPCVQLVLRSDFAEGKREAARPRCAPIAPEATEILFEEAGSHDRTVEAEQRRQSRVLGLGEVLRILQPQEARVFELRLLGAG